MPIWTWDYSLADAKITNVKNSNNHLLLEVDCSWTALHSRQYITMLIFETVLSRNYPILLVCSGIVCRFLDVRISFSFVSLLLTRRTIKGQ